uniref:U1-type domain-containing protein n=1 Tax=Leersia perrieri TaxID=77586 RepID=A0A0D9XDU4_9ORYZ
MDFATAHGVADAPPHGGDPMVVVWEIMAGKLAKIERAIALRNASPLPRTFAAATAGAVKTSSNETTAPKKQPPSEKCEPCLPTLIGTVCQEQFTCQSKSATSEVMDEQKELMAFCDVCKLQCNSKKMLSGHRNGKKHQAKFEKIFEASSNGSSSKGATSEVMDEHKVCSLNCTSYRMLGDHLYGKKHLKEEALLAFCDVCKLQCSSDHREGKKHRAKLEKIFEPNLYA